MVKFEPKESVTKVGFLCTLHNLSHGISSHAAMLRLFEAKSISDKDVVFIKENLAISQLNV